MKNTPLLTNLELELMQIIWKNQDVSVEFLRTQLSDNGHPLALPSVRTMLSILGKKGFVERRLESRAYVYNALIPADGFQHSFVKDLLKRAFGGSAGICKVGAEKTGHPERHYPGSRLPGVTDGI